MFEETTVTDQPGTETADIQDPNLSSEESSAETEGQELGAGGATAEETQAEEYQLPDEQSKVFPETALREYAAHRYPELLKMLEDENLAEPTRAQVQQILHDKLNTDIYLAKQNQEDEPEEEIEEPEPAADQPKPLDPAEVEIRLNQIVDQITDPKVSVQFVNRLAEADQIKDPQQRAIAVTKALTYGMANALRDLLPAFLDGPGGWLEQRIGGYLNQNFEGFGESYKQNSYQSAWEGIKSSDPRFSNLPAFNTPEWMEAAREAAAIVPGFEHAVYTDPKTGKPLSAVKNFERKAEAMANILARTRGNTVANATKAVETGRRLARDAQQRKSNAKLGAGQSQGRLATQSSNDPLKAAIAAQRADADPFAALRQQ